MAAVIKLDTKVTFRADYDSTRNRTVFVVEAGKMKATTRHYPGKYTAKQVEHAWRQQPAIWNGQANEIREIERANVAA